MRELATHPVLTALDADLESGPAVVAIGGGHGLALALRSIREYAMTITAIVGVADDGGSSGRLAPALAIPPPGDIRRCLIALTPGESAWRELFSFRFDQGDVKGHSLGNLILAALTEMTGDFEDAVRAAEIYLGASGSVVPAARDQLQLEAVVDGHVVHGQRNISLARGEVSAMRVQPDWVVANPRALAAIAEADQVVLGPGSLYTSTIAALAVPGMVAAVNGSGARLVYVCNLTTQDGETFEMDGGAHVEALTATVGLRAPDAIVASTSELDVPAPLEQVQVDSEALKSRGIEVVLDDFAEHGSGWPRHDAFRLAMALRSLAAA